MPIAVAPFTVTARPAVDDADAADAPVLGLTVFDKLFTGETLTGTSVVRMVSALGLEGPLAYVALERVEGVLEGRKGAFILRHVGSVVDGQPVLDIEVVTGSGVGGLAGLSGSGTIVHAADGARLELTYLVP